MIAIVKSMALAEAQAYDVQRWRVDSAAYCQYMPIASLTIELRIEHAHSLKDRRQVVRSLKEKLKSGFNVSVAELDEAVTWQSATLGVVAVSNSRDYLTGLMQQVENAATRISNDLGAHISDCWWQFVDE